MLEIANHIRRTNNTLIFGQLNTNAQQGVPSLRSAVTGAENWGQVINDIYSDDDSKRLVIQSIDDVTRIFKPTYYFSVGSERVDGADRMVVEHSLQHKDNALPVEITRETLCFKILDQRGRVQLADILTELRKDLAKARDHYLAATRSRNPKRLTEQEDLRRNFISRLTEPVVTYLVAAESCRNYETLKGDAVNGDAAPSEQVKTITIVKPNLDTLQLERATLEVKVAKDDVLEQPDHEETVKSRLELESDIRVGQKLLGAAVEGYLAGAESADSLPDTKRRLLEALTATGVSAELMVDHITEEAASYKLLAQSSTQYLADQPDLLLTDGSGRRADAADDPVASADGTDDEGASEAPSSTEHTTTAPQALVKTQGGTNAAVAKAQIENMRDGLSSDELLDHVQVIENAALQYYQDDDRKQNQIVAYVQTLTPVGRIQNKMVELGKRRGGARKLKGEEGFRFYLEMCLEEACQKSALVKHFESWIRKALLNEPYEIKLEDENRWIAFHDQIMNAAQKTFEDYMGKVAPVVTQLMGIDTFLKASSQAKQRAPHVIVANMALDDLLTDDDTFEGFSRLLRNLNDYNQEQFERAVSIIVAPGLEAFDAGRLFKAAFEQGASVFFSPYDVIGFNTLNDPGEVERILEEWVPVDAADVHYQSGVLCVPDSVLLPAGFKFRLGEYLSNNKTCSYTTDRGMSVRGCFSAAGIVARNDDTSYVEQALKQQKQKLRLEKNWPAISLRFGDQRVEPLYVTDYLSEGVILKQNLSDSLPLCLFEHSTDKSGRLKNQRVRFLNTLYVLGGRPVPLYEYRAAKYLNRVLRLNYPNGAKTNELKYFAETSYAGIYKEGYDNSILDKERYDMKFDPESGYFGVINKAQDQEITGFEFGLEEASA